MEPFVYEALPVRVIFGSGTVAQLAAEAERLGVRRVPVLSMPGRGEVQANEIAALLGERSAGVHAGAVMHTPVAVTERAVQIVRERAVDAVVSYGGGSTTGLGKAIALRTDLPQIVLPTTYAGSEVTPVLGETKDGVKMTQRTLKVLPEVVVYDGFCQGSRHCPWPTRAWLGIGPASHRGVDEDAVYRMWLGSRDRAIRAHRSGLSPVPLPSLRQAVQRALRHSAEPDAVSLRRHRARGALALALQAEPEGPARDVRHAWHRVQL